MKPDFKALWRKWTIDKPADFGDWLWMTFVVDFARFLDALTVAQAIRLLSIFAIAAFLSFNLPVELAILFAGDTVLYIELTTIAMLLSASVRIASILQVLARSLTSAVRPVVSSVRRTRRLVQTHRIRRRKRLAMARKRTGDTPDLRPAAAWDFAPAFA